MTTLTSSEGKVLTYTNALTETVLLQLDSSNYYYTTGDNDVLFSKIGSNKVLILYYPHIMSTELFFRIIQ